MLLNKGISVERSLAEISDGQRVVLLVIFTFEHRHIFPDTAVAVAYAEPSTNIVDCFASELGKDDGLLRGTDVSTEQADQNRALQGLMKQFHTCFAWSTECENCQSRSTKYPPKRFKKHFSLSILHNYVRRCTAPQALTLSCLAQRTWGNSNPSQENAR